MLGIHGDARIVRDGNGYVYIYTYIVAYLRGDRYLLTVVLGGTVGRNVVGYVDNTGSGATPIMLCCSS